MKNLNLFIITFLLTTISFAQSNSINYKAIIKDGSGNVIANTAITVQFQILEDVTNVYQETHTPTTDANGLVILNIGEGTTGDIFTDIDWGSDDHFLNVQVDTGSGLVDMGTTQFLAVPYALNAGNGGAQNIDDLSDAKSDSDGTEDGSSIFLGVDAGLNDDSSDNKNVGIGYKALNRNISGTNNTAFGYKAGLKNIIGNSNIFLGYNAGYSELGNNKLYIENSGASANDALIYGEFDSNIFRINGELQISNPGPSHSGYAFPTADGLINQVLQTDGNGQLSFADNDNTQNTLDEAYDEGGAGLGRTINTTDGAVLLDGADGLEVTGSTAGIVISNTDETESGIHFRDSENTTEYADIKYDSNISDNLNFYVGNTSPVASFTNDQKVGLGTTTPENRLSVIGTISASSDATEGSKLVLQHSGTYGLVWSKGTGSLNFATGLYTRMKITDAGKVGIGMTGVTDPQFKLDINEYTPTGTDYYDRYVAQIYNSNPSTGVHGLKIRLAAEDTESTNYYIGFHRGDNNREGMISGKSDSTWGVLYSSVSDRRLKTKIVDIKNSLALINKIQPRLYEYKSGQGAKEYGFIAQELQPLYPQAVSGSPDSDVTKNPMMVDYSRLTPILTAGIKELSEEIEILKQENKELKTQLSKIELLEARLNALENK